MVITASFDTLKYSNLYINILFNDLFHMASTYTLIKNLKKKNYLIYSFTLYMPLKNYYDECLLCWDDVCKTYYYQKHEIYGSLPPQ